MFGSFPIFSHLRAEPAPLTAKLKFKLAMKALTDPVTITGFGMNSAIYQAADYPSYGQGASAYGTASGRHLCGRLQQDLLGDAVLPSLLIKIHATFIKVPAQRNPALCTLCQLRLSREETTATRDQLLQHPRRLGLRRNCERLLSQPGSRRRTCARGARWARPAVWLLASFRSSCCTSGRRNTPVSHNPVNLT